MAFNLFGSIGQENTDEKPKNNLFVLPPKNKIEEIREKAASDTAILELNKEADKLHVKESEEKADAGAKEKSVQKAEKKAKPENGFRKLLGHVFSCFAGGGVLCSLYLKQLTAYLHSSARCPIFCGISPQILNGTEIFRFEETFLLPLSFFWVPASFSASGWDLCRSHILKKASKL